MTIPTEPIGSIPRPLGLIEADFTEGRFAIKIDPRAESPEEVRDRTLESAEYLPIAQLGTCDDCGFSPFCDDTTTSRETAFEKIRARLAGTALAAQRLGSR